MALLTNLDQQQILQNSHDEPNQSLRVTGVGGALVTEPFDYVEMTNSTIAGQVVPTTIEYRSGGASGTLVATLTLTYDVDANLETITRT